MPHNKAFLHKRPAIFVWQEFVCARNARPGKIPEGVRLRRVQEYIRSANDADFRFGERGIYLLVVKVPIF